MDPQQLADVALAGGRLAAVVCRRVQAEEVLSGVPEAKAGDEPVTVADYAAQALILRAVRQSFPDHDVLSEEDSAHLRGQADDRVGRRVQSLVAQALDADVSFERLCEWIDHSGDPRSPFRWAIDPIDGTKGFLRRDQYAVAIGVLERGEPIVGVLVCPSLAVDPALPDGPRGVAFVAVKGRGTRQIPLDGGDATRVHVSATRDPARVRVLGSVEASHGDPRLLTELVEDLHLGGGIVRVDSQVKYGVLARGGAEIYLRPRSRPDWRDKVWDHAAGVLVAVEAGGMVTDMDGRRLDFDQGKTLAANHGVLATHGPLHPEVVASLGRLLGT